MVEDQTTNTDAIVVLMGSIPDRILQAIDLYEEGVSHELILVNSHMVGHDILLERGVDAPNAAIISKDIAIEIGVLDEDIILLDGDAKSTKDEAIALRDYLREEKSISSISLVTSKYHSRRAKKTFARVLEDLDRDITIVSSPSKYDSFKAEVWWKDREDFKKLVMEYLKFINFYLRDQYNL